MRRWLSMAAGVGQTLAIVVLFVAGGVAFGALSARRGGEPYAPAMAGSVWLVDGFNVIQVGLLAGRERSGFWRAERRAELLERAARLDEPEAEVVVVFDGARPAEDTSERPRAVFAPSADEWLLERLRAEVEPARVHVVTADRRLAERARQRGARVVAPAEFLARCGG